MATKNSEVLAAIANAEGTSEALRSVLEPAIDGGVVEYNEAFQAIKANAQTMNEFVSALSNVLGQVHVDNIKAWNNPLEDLQKDDLLYGDTIEEVYTNLFKAKAYKVNGNGSPWEQEIPDSKAIFHKINRQKVYEATKTRAELQKAFLTEGGLERYLTQIDTQLVNSAKRDRYEATMKIMTDNYKYNGMVLQHVDKGTTDEETAKNLLKAIRTTYRHFKFFSQSYNKFECDTFSDDGDIHVFVTPEVLENINVNRLADAFNLELTDFKGKLTVVDSFGDTGCQVIIADGRSFMIFEKLFETYSIFDPKHLTINTFLHDQGLYSFSQFMNCVALTHDVVYDSAVTAVEVTGDSTVTKGQTIQLTATVTGDEENAVYYSLQSTGADNGSYISDSGVLYCSSDEKTGTKFRITAYSKKNCEVSGELIVSVA